VYVAPTSSSQAKFVGFRVRVQGLVCACMCMYRYIYTYMYKYVHTHLFIQRSGEYGLGFMIRVCNWSTAKAIWELAHSDYENVSGLYIYMYIYMYI